ncbi:MAG: DMT family transporter [Thermomicrobiales bacterium]
MDTDGRFQNLGSNLALLAIAAIWGGNFVGMKHLINEVGALKVLLLRVYIAAIVFAGVLLLRRGHIPRFNRQEWKLLTLVGFFGVVTNQLFVSYGTSYLSAAVASMIATSTPVFMAILSRVLLGERLGARKLTGISLAFTGFVIVLFYGSGQAEFSVTNALGVFITALAPLSWTTSTLISTRLMLRHDPTIITGISTVIGGVTLLPVLVTQSSLFTDVQSFGMTEWAAAFVTSVLSVVVAYTVWYRALRHLEPTQIAVYVYLVPFFGVIFAWILLDEPITKFVVLGGMTILSGVALTNTARRKTAVPAAQLRESQQASPVVD